ncbi:MAG: YbaB/EbfC family nucleoid-associated protein [Nitrospiraceae bacterium]|nr:YbaB/EbfC family nucleoid-associated protein [Nitrospiraceae bacterium]
MNIPKLLEQAQEIQLRMDEERSSLHVEATVGGGMVRIAMDGHKQVISVKIDPKAVDLDDLSLLEDLLVAGFNETSRKTDDKVRDRFGNVVSHLPPFF